VAHSQNYYLSQTLYSGMNGGMNHYPSHATSWSIWAAPYPYPMPPYAMPQNSNGGTNNEETADEQSDNHDYYCLERVLGLIVSFL
jgi:hypothetical protein